MKLRKTIIVLLMAVGLTAFAACADMTGTSRTVNKGETQSQSNAPQSGLHTPEFVGTWTLNELDGPDDPVSSDGREILTDVGLDAQLELRQDGWFELDTFGVNVDGTWLTVDDTSINLNRDGTTIAAKLTDGKLSFKYEGALLTFIKTSDDVK